MATVARLTGYIYDADLELEDGLAAIIADGEGSAIVDLGASVHVTGDIVVDVSAIDLVTGDEQYTIIAELSDDSGHASGIEPMGALLLGGVTASLGNRDVASTVGRYILPFNNQMNDRVYRYLRLHFDVGGTTPSITCVAYLSKSRQHG